VYLLGDLFDSWIGDDQLRDPLAERVAMGIRSVANSGVPVGMINGNRDFLLGERFAEVAGATLLPEQIVINLAGTPTLLLHGDELCTADVEYQRYRRFSRNPRNQRIFLAFPYVLRRGFAGLMRRRSKVASAVKPESIMDVEHRAVESAFREANVKRIIHGHTHRPAHHHLIVDERDCERWVLADWYAHGSYLEFDAEGGRTRDV
jgi:UDP-2,3-diacylglucosamine hydrolase